MADGVNGLLPHLRGRDLPRRADARGHAESRRFAADRADNAAASETDLVEYISEIRAATAVTLDDVVVYQTYATTFRGIEFLMGYYPILDRAPKGRGEGEGFQLWIHAATSTTASTGGSGREPNRK